MTTRYRVRSDKRRLSRGGYGATQSLSGRGYPRVARGPQSASLMGMPKINPFLWFDGNAEQAAMFYVSVFPKSKIVHVARYGDAGPGPKGSVMLVDFQIAGHHFQALNGGPTYKISPAISFMVQCADQKEVDYYWTKLSAGGKKVECGWLEDKFGVSWQIVPSAMFKMMKDKNREKVARAFAAMMTMKKLDLAKLQKAFDGR